MLGFGVFMQYATCLICADEIATGELRQHLTGDYHTGCFTTIAAAGITVDRWTGEEATCALCQQDIARQAVVVKPAHLVVHLRCFFTPPRAARKSLGAAAAMPEKKRRRKTARRRAAFKKKQKKRRARAAG